MADEITIPGSSFNGILEELNRNSMTQTDAMLNLADSIDRLVSVSQSGARTAGYGSDPMYRYHPPLRESSANTEDGKESSEGRDQRLKLNRRGFQNSEQQIAEAFRDSLLDSLGGSQFKDMMGKSLNDFAKQLGGDLSTLPSDLGKKLGEKALSAVKSTDFGKNLSADINMVTQKLGNGLSSGLGKLGSWLGGSGGAASTAEAVLSTGAASAELAGTAGAVTAGAGAAGAGTAGAGALAAGTAATGGTLLVAIGAVAVAMIAFEKILDTVGPALDGIADVAKAASKAWSRYDDEREQFLEYAKDRTKKDIESITQIQFDIVTESANKIEEIWDSVLTTITATQGYTKADLQDLMASFAQRLRDEGLSSVVSAADMTSNLAKVLDSGLSGKVAEEFAYIATKLNAAIPTEDFFQYASTYAEIAANAIKNGAERDEAIQIANKQLESFANNLLYASRELAGGFSTGLNNASSLLEDAVKITTAAKTGDSTSVSGVLTSISAIAGAIAPDLASGLVSNVVSAALGGNSSEIVALRSIAGINASNTEFLKALATDPQRVFASLFENLARLQNMSNDNFMEVAEGLSSVFGVSMDAFARVDFEYLAQAISAMDTTSSALNQNLEMLVSGETTSTAEQQRMAQINEYILEEGLSYVLDNEAARQIQQHMWDEQLAREMMEATYGVEIQGALLSLVQGLAQTVSNILNLLNPFSWVKGVMAISQSVAEAAQNELGIKKLLEAGKVGKGNREEYYNLTTKNANLDLSTSLLDWYGIKTVNTDIMREMTGALTGGLGSRGNYGNTILGAAAELGRFLFGNDTKNSISSPTGRYNWSMLSKSEYNALSSSSFSSGNTYQAITSATEAMANKTNARFKDFLNTMDSYVEANKSYEDWIASAYKYGISDIQEAIDNYGTTSEDLSAAFSSRETAQAAKREYERQEIEDKFWENSNSFYEKNFPEFHDELTAFEELLTSQQDEQILELQKISKEIADFYNEWVEYYVEHTAYSRETLSAYDVAAIKNAEKDQTGDAVLALAQALTSNAVDLKDPAVQTNVLLSQILIVAEAIMQQNNNTTTTSLPTALSALGLGITK